MILRTAAILAIGSSVCLPRAGFAANASVSIVDFAFSPTNVVINTSESVTWSWVGSSAHSSTSFDTNLWNSGILGPGATFTHTFSSAGNFPYHCLVHPTMLASVTVQGQAPSPVTIGSVKRTSPTSFQFSYNTTSGLSYVVQRSADLSHWSSLATNTASGTSVTFSDTAASNTANFYRVLPLGHL